MAVAPPPSPPSVRGSFLLCVCQGGVEQPLIARQQAILPAFAPGAWRRGVVTFRIGPADFDPPDDFFPDLILAHTVIRSLGQVVGDARGPGSGGVSAAAIEGVLRLVEGGRFDAIHAWPRTARVADAKAADPDDGLPVAAVRAAVAMAAGIDPGSERMAAPARRGDLVLDIVLDAPERWWVGWHRVNAPPTSWPGGAYPGTLPAGAVSRAWLKLDEALTTFAVPLTPGERAIEFGASPGGACQRLLEAGLSVVGVDAAVVHEQVAGHPRFEQWRMRAREVPLARFRGCEWLLADMNIDPADTMDALGRVLEPGAARPKGVIATLKMPTWSRAAEIDGWLAAFRSWGYVPQARHLSTAGREICVVALRGRGGRGRGPRTV